MDWNKLVFTAGQAVVVVVLGVLVGTGHNSAVTDGLLAVCGSLAGVGIFQQVIARRGGPTGPAG